MDDLTLPGSIPGLLRRGSPVVLGRTRLTVASGPLTLTGDEVADLKAKGIDAGDRALGVAGGDGYYRLCPEVLLALDLTDATGRAHAAWWLAGAVMPRVPVTEGARWSVLHSHPSGRGRWFLRGDMGADCPFAAEDGWIIVPSLADLDPNDPRLLPDGSRWVDAEALRRVVLHVAGVPHA